MVMANPFVIAAALAGTVAITCPHCGKRKLVKRVAKTHRVCPRCHKRFPDPLASRRSR
jgi:uncharacterized protein (DUF983 family)